jgi:hypothetical protein
MASTFPIADRYFCSAMAQTDPNRRYLIAGTSLGLIDDTFPSALPPNGVIFQQFNKHGITWKDYYSTLPTLGVFLPLISDQTLVKGLAHIDQFYVDAAAGNLPSFSLVEPNYDEQSEENPQDIQFGDQFVGKVVNAVMSSPNWPKTMLIWNYDEHGGYYDHVPPPAAIPPDDVPPALVAGDPARRIRPVRFQRPRRGGQPLCQEGLRLPHDLRPHLGSQDRRGEVEPACADPSRCQRQQFVRYVGLRHQAGILEAAESSPPPPIRPEGRMPDHWCRHHPSSVGGHQGLTEGHQRPRTSPGSASSIGASVRFTWRANRSQGMAGHDRGRAWRRATAPERLQR